MKQELIIIKDEIWRNLKAYKVVFLVIGLYLLFFFLFDPHGPNCLIKRTTGFPCPTCGMTRAMYYFFTLQFEKAFYYHPLFLVVFFVALVFLLRGYKIFHTLYKSKVFWGFIIVLFATVYITRMIMYFPDVSPMDFYYK